MNARASRLLTAAAATALVVATVLVHDHAVARQSHFRSEDDLLYLPRPAALHALSLGHHELVADLVFVRAVIYYGGELAAIATRPALRAGAHGDYRWLENYLDTILKLDPHLKTPYRWA